MLHRSSLSESSKLAKLAKLALCASVLPTFCLFTICLSVAHAAVANPAAAGEDFQVQGEYAGEISIEGETLDAAVQVVALGNGEFIGVGYIGGLPGAGWNQQNRYESGGKWQGDAVILQSSTTKATIQNDKLTIEADGQTLGELSKVQRKSPTLNAQPPEGAVVLFDGSGTDQWIGGQTTEDGLLLQGTTSRPTFQDHRLHIEFQLPYQPQARGQARGNSGLYLQGRYEVQMLDSFGLTGEHNECGGIYSIKAPSVNMCLPPLTWQTYDVDFKAASYDDDGELVSNPRVTVFHNGVKIHDDVELPKSTTAAPKKPGPEPGPVYLQDHGNPVRYRNIWVVPK